MSIAKISQEEVYNKDLLEFAKPTLICSICNGILIDPYQCTTCLSYFCKECIGTVARKSPNCPIKKCVDFRVKQSVASKGMVEKLKFTCKNGCDKIIDYCDLDNHYNKECSKMNYSEKYLEILEEINRIKFQNKLKERDSALINQNVEHIKDAHFYVEKMKNHPTIARTDWSTLESKMSRNFNSIKTIAEEPPIADDANQQRREALRDRIIPASSMIGPDQVFIDPVVFNRDRFISNPFERRLRDPFQNPFNDPDDPFL